MNCSFPLFEKSYHLSRHITMHLLGWGFHFFFFHDVISCLKRNFAYKTCVINRRRMRKRRPKIKSWMICSRLLSVSPKCQCPVGNHLISLVVFSHVIYKGTLCYMRFVAFMQSNTNWVCDQVLIPSPYYVNFIKWVSVLKVLNASSHMIWMFRGRERRLIFTAISVTKVLSRNLLSGHLALLPYFSLIRFVHPMMGFDLFNFVVTVMWFLSFWRNNGGLGSRDFREGCWIKDNWI